jgi:probable HAF family extracellular repeat protein
MKTKQILFVLLGIFCLLTATAQAQVDYRYLSANIGAQHGSFMKITSVSPDGSRFVGIAKDAQNTQRGIEGQVVNQVPTAYYRSNLPDALTVLTDINDIGQVVGYNYSGNTPQAFYYVSNGANSVSSFEYLGDLPGGAIGSQAFGVSASGDTIAGDGNSTNGAEAFRWQADTPGSATGMVSGLGDLPGSFFASGARGINATGSVIVGFGVSEDAGGGAQVEASRWTMGGGMVGLGDLPGGDFVSQANATNADGSVIVGYGTIGSGKHAFRWTASSGMVSLPGLPGEMESQALSVTADGSFVVGYSRVVQFDERAGVPILKDVGWFWTEADGTQDLRAYLESAGAITNPLTHYFSRITDVSADGTTLVGWRDDLNPTEPTNINNASGFYLHSAQRLGSSVSAPEPSTLALLMLAPIFWRKKRN